MAAFDYFAIENGNYAETSIYWLIQQLVKKVRYIRSQIPADKIQEHLPELHSLERKIQELEMGIGEPRINYIAEINQVLKADNIY
ncbi:hypothetical protein CLV51_11017 [Chitinophaga niastensis]|uniref:Uncharacterized protein n=1 Tax=Chitinophaga niastensis TaxID=536980 RepID=A0A2P8H9D3_CHINA|nr:hypothetical protein [Chitinophaga niastensis]PSL42801.1 hypothetical protein CLV51_11017 [Chitinophaga niastensis]